MASVYQIKRLIAQYAAALVWGSAPGNVVFTGGAVVSEELDAAFAPASFRPDSAVNTGALPFARVSCDVVDFDRENPARIEMARFHLWCTAGGGNLWPGVTSASQYDTHGLNMENGSLSTGAGQSVGRSTDELWARFVESLGTDANFTISKHGFQGWCYRSDPPEPVAGVQVLTRPISIEVYSATVSAT